MLPGRFSVAMFIFEPGQFDFGLGRRRVSNHPAFEQAEGGIGIALLGQQHGQAAVAVGVIWIAIEGFQNYRKARQRLRLGLCAPLVCNRYLLWGLAGAVWILFDLALIAQYIDYEITQFWSPSLDVLVGTLGASAVAIIWFVFFPPARYRRWIQAADSAATDAEG